MDKDEISDTQRWALNLDMKSTLGGFAVAGFAIIFRHAPALIGYFNPMFKWILKTPAPAGPNALLTTRGRISGRLNSTPVALLDLGDRCFVQAASATAGWARNLRTTGICLITQRGKRRRFRATELAPEEGGKFAHELLAAFPRNALVARVVGPKDRPPIGVLHYFRIRVDDDVDAYVSSARRQPIFALLDDSADSRR